jgi:hypothetical protein
MRRLILGLSFIALATPAFAGDVYVRGYYRDNGTYVQPHYRSSPNNTTYDNFSVRGNPYTGERGSNSLGSSFGSGSNLYGSGSGSGLNLYGGSNSRRW